MTSERKYVYLAQAGSLVKIGLSRKPERRVAVIDGYHPAPVTLKLMVPGDNSTETALHCRFEQSRIRGEWFLRGDLLLEQLLNTTVDAALPIVAELEERWAANGRRRPMQPSLVLT